MKSTAFFPSLAALLALSAFCFADAASDEQTNATLRELTRGNVPGFAVLVARDGKVVFQGGFGFADVEKKKPITTATKFRIGSISKQFTAAAILKLAEEKKLATSDPLAKFFPKFPHGNEITLRHLLTHTSGIHSYTEKPDFLNRVSQRIEPGKLIEYFEDDPPDFAPGAGFRYDNSGYFLLGEIVHKISGKPLREYLRETFFDPLEMKDTGVFVNAAPPQNMAIGYSVTDGKSSPALDWDMSWAGGAGALYSTVGDLFRWNEALFNGRVVNEESFKQATTPVELPANVDGLKYGFGLVMSEMKKLRAIGHNGGLNGWSSDLVRLPDQKCTVVVLSNTLPSAPGCSPAEILRSLIERFLADEIQKQPPQTEDKSVDPKSFAAYVGRYDYSGAILTVAVENDHLFAQLTGQAKYEIFPKGGDEFFWKIADAQVVFQRDEKREVVAARHSQNGNVFTAPRMRDESVKLTDAQLEAVLGQYQYGPAAVLTVTRDGSQVFAQLTGQPKMPIFPKSASEFEWRVVVAQVNFVKDENGKIVKAVHHQNGNSFDAPKIK